jgi:hypothetical protein
VVKVSLRAGMHAMLRLCPRGSVGGVGAWMCASVASNCQTARRRSHSTRRTRNTQRAVHKQEGTVYVVKCFNMMVEANRHMLIEEVKLMMAMNCDSIVRFKGAFLDDCKVSV